MSSWRRPHIQPDFAVIILHCSPKVTPSEMRHVLVHHTPHALLSTLPEGPVESPRERGVTAVVAHLRVQLHLDRHFRFVLYVSAAPC
ncbi:hypothetical protein VTO73DRAFT_10345 [Trametes versicolor]